ncbi:MAG: ribosomal protein S18-alanine N-acetyltransferase [Sutterellaceae bacterium]|nr:ribosomal protein S18-alanine N-acetyltransferase [Burkholderiaceae bacterium]MCX7902338.1 ribosomal protein S18-alanine N-acetyltransferase [Burkholderiaceae bacterium]MDW8429343.1 ribosomal protein S18-alanine N-acetyltransferase [Sutterellaceae bacterium]
MAAVLRPQEERFEPMRAQDLDEVIAVERDIYPFPWTRGNFQDALAAGYSAWLLRAPHGSLIAYAVVMVALDEAHLLNLSVARLYQRRGYGWRMLDWMARCARDEGARTMLLEVRPSNAPALGLYARYGFQRIGVRRGYYPAHGGREDAIVMRISL